MSIDARARAATQELHDVMVGRVPAASRVARRGVVRRRARFASVAVATVVAVAGGLLIGGRNLSQQPAPPPVAPRPTITGLACQLDGITCADGRMRVAGGLLVPVSFVPAPGVNTDDISPGTSNLTIRRTEGGPGCGLAIFELPHPVDGQRGRPAPASASASAEQAARWLATRSFVVPTEPVRVNVAGLDAWRVETTLRDGATLDDIGADGERVAFAFVNADGTGNSGATAVSPHLRTAYHYLIDVPGHGLVVAWVWTYGGRPQDLDAMDAMVSTLRFG